jgi:hypothetical protein
LKRNHLATLAASTTPSCEKEALYGIRNPTTFSYTASVVKIYSATNSMARFNNKNNLFL